MPTIVDFAYTGAQQSTTVPAGVVAATLECWGAEGGPTGSGGKGAHITARITDLVSLETLYVYVGQLGPTPQGQTAFNGGAPGGNDFFDGSSGGGATDIRRGGTALANRILVGGAGGGRGSGGGTNFPGGNGGYPTGASAGGGGGTASAGGSAGGGGGSTAGTLGVGGNGGSNGTFQSGGGGGGGGYYGGGGGGAPAGTAGGGGSSYAHPSLSSVTGDTSAAAAWTGNGKARITFDDPVHIGNVDLAGASVGATPPLVDVPHERPIDRKTIWVYGLDGVKRNAIARPSV